MPATTVIGLTFSQSAAIAISATPTCGSDPTVIRTVLPCASSTRLHPPARTTTLSRTSCVTTSNIGRPKAAMRIPTMRELYWAPSQNLAVHSNGLR